MKDLKDDAALEAWLQSLFPPDGVIAMRTFRIPKKAAAYEIVDGKNVNRVPLRNAPDDIRVGIAVYDHAKRPIMVNAIEAKAGVLVEELRADVVAVIGYMIQEATADGYARG